MKFEKCVRESLRFVAIKGHGRLSINPISLAGAHEILLSQVFEFLLISTVFKRIIFLKFSHVSDDGTEIDSKDNIHPSFVII